MEIEKEVLGILTGVIGEQVTKETTCDEMDFDSIDMAIVSLDVEEKFGVSLNEEDFEKSHTAGNLAKIVERRLNNGN